MTSMVARYNGLTPHTCATYERYGRNPRNIDDRFHFFSTYLQEVIPSGVTINHIPTDLSNVTGNPPRREEIQLLTPSGKIFMSCLVSMDYNNPFLPEEIAADEAYTKRLDGYFVPDGQNWRFFTAVTLMRFFKCRRDDWDLVGQVPPIEQAQAVAAYMQQEYDRLESH